eukprot:1159519-Pelagomonas_calceolata.AAC.18
MCTCSLGNGGVGAGGRERGCSSMCSSRRWGGRVVGILGVRARRVKNNGRVIRGMGGRRWVVLRELWCAGVQISSGRERCRCSGESCSCRRAMPEVVLLLLL